MEPEKPPTRRGRPPRPSDHPLGEYLRQRRVARQLTVRDLAKLVGLPESSAGYISQLEAGTKIPNPELAAQLVKRLGDPLGAFMLWPMLGRRAEARDTASARRRLAQIFRDPRLAMDVRFGSPEDVRLEHGDAWTMRRRTAWREDDEQPASHHSADALAPLPPVSEARAEGPPAMDHSPPMYRPDAGRVLRVPMLRDAIDPDRAGELLGFARIDADRPGLEPMVEPFAFHPSPESVRRVAHVLEPGDLVVVTREPAPIQPHEIYLVRVDERVVLSQAMWNGRQLLLLPGIGGSDFIVLDAPDEAAVRRLVIGHVAMVTRGGSFGWR